MSQRLLPHRLHDPRRGFDRGQAFFDRDLGAAKSRTSPLRILSTAAGRRFVSNGLSRYIGDLRVGRERLAVLFQVVHELADVVQRPFRQDGERTRVFRQDVPAKFCQCAVHLLDLLQGLLELHFVMDHWLTLPLTPELFSSGTQAIG
jgi:hypothetical protein